MSALTKDIKPPILYPVHHPTTEKAAPAASKFFSFSFICSILRASIVMSWVADEIAIASPTAIISQRFSVGFKKLQLNNEIKMNDCIKMIQDFL